jgi:two-component system, LytTR family, response regulator
MTIRTVIVDDEPPARRRISSLLSRDPSLHLVGECGDGASAIEMITEERPELVFLDVQMPGTDGFSVVDSLRHSALPYVIFVTAYDQYAIKAFEIGAVDYLLKPFSRKRFETCVQRAKERILNAPADTGQQELRAFLRQSTLDRDRLVVRSKGNLVFLRTPEIEWIAAAGNYVRIHAGKQLHSIREKIGDIEQRLHPSRFLRVHRSIIVNIDAVAEVQRCGSGEYVVLLRDGRELPLGRSYRERLNELLQPSK